CCRTSSANICWEPFRARLSLSRCWCSARWREDRFWRLAGLVGRFQPERNESPAFTGRKTMRGNLMKLAFAALTAGALAFGGAASAQDKKVTIGVSIPAADHGWTAGVVYHAERVAKLLMEEHPGLNVIVKT